MPNLYGNISSNANVNPGNSTGLYVGTLNPLPNNAEALLALLSNNGSVTFALDPISGNTQVLAWGGNGGGGGDSNYTNVNVASFLPTYSGIMSASTYYGDGSNLTNLPAGNYSNANVAAFLPTYLPTYTGNIAAGNVIAGKLYGDGSKITNLPIGNYSNANVASYMPVYGGNITAANITAGNVSATYFIGNGSKLTNLPTGNYSNANVASYLTVYGGPIAASTLTATGNVSGQYLIGDGSQITNLPPGNYSNANVAAFLPTYTGTLANSATIVSMNSSISSLNTSVSSLNTSVSSLNTSVSAISGNVTTLQGQVATLNTSLASTNSNVANLTTGLASTNSNVANLTTGLASTNSNVATLQTQMTGKANLSGATFTGNVTAPYFIGNGSALTGLPSPTVSLVGDVSGTGSTGSNIQTTLANSGVTAGTYGASEAGLITTPSITVDAKGRVISAGSNTVTAVAGVQGTPNQITAGTAFGIATIGLPANLVAPGTVTVAGNLTAPNVSANLFGNVTGTILTATQNNITKIGTQTLLNVSGNATVANLTANTGITTNTLTATTIAGTLSTAAQPNITSVGNLTALTVAGNLTVNDRITVTNGVSATTFTGMLLGNVSAPYGLVSAGNIGTTSSALVGANLSIAGTSSFNNTVTVKSLVSNTSVTANTFVGTLTTAAQPNITSVGNLTALTVAGNATVTGNATIGNLAITSAVTASSLTGTHYGNLYGNVRTAAQPYITSLGNLTALSVAGTTSLNGDVTANSSVTVLGNVNVNANAAINTVGNIYVNNSTTLEGYKTYRTTFTTSGTFNAPANLRSIRVLLVGGGGAGGVGDGDASAGIPGLNSKAWFMGGGGGAGGLIETDVTANVTPGQAYSIVVGGGGQIADNGVRYYGNPGGNTTAFGLTAIGGAPGGIGYPLVNATDNTRYNGNNGGSGGGGGAQGPAGYHAGGTGTAGQGYAGGQGYYSLSLNPSIIDYYKGYGGGGGGAGGVGEDGKFESGYVGASGGSGVYSAISGTPTLYAPGGGGGYSYIAHYNYGPSPGNTIEYSQGSYIIAPGAGGAGGSMSRNVLSPYLPTAGRSGIVVIEYTTWGDIVTKGNITTTGYFVGDGSKLTNLPSGNYSNVNVAAYLPVYNGPVAASTLTATGNVSGQYILGDGSLLTNLPAGNYSNANVASYLPVYGGNVDANIATANKFQVDTAAVAAGSVGGLVWNDGAGTIEFQLKGGDVTLQLGQEQVARVYNGTGTTLTDGQVVYVTGAQGQRPTVQLASASSEATSTRTFGVVTETIAAGAEGFVTTAGIVSHLNTSAYAEGAVLWLGTTPGTFTTTQPTAPTHSVLVGYVLRSHATAGSIYVHLQNGYELGELHDVLITNVANNDMLVYNSTSSVWKNQTPANVKTSLGLANVATTGDYNDLINKPASANGNVILTGDVTGSGTTNSNITTTLSNTGVTAGSYGSSTLVPVITIDAKGRITSANTVAVSGGGGGGATSLNDLTDVVITAAETNDILRFDGTYWVDTPANTLAVGMANTVSVIADNTTNATYYPLFANATSGNLTPRTDTGFTYNPGSQLLTTTGFYSTGSVTAAGGGLGPKMTITGDILSPAWGNAGIALRGNAFTARDTTSSGTIADSHIYAIAAPTLVSNNTVTVTDAATFYIGGGPNASGNTTITNKWALLANGPIRGTDIVSSNLVTKAQGELRLSDADSSNYVGFKAPATVTSNLVWTLPATDGTSNQVLTTNGTGGLTWSSAANGAPGADGVSVTNANVDVNGNLQVTLSNATVINAGYVIGPQGPQGNVGPAGTNGTNGTNGVDGVSVTNANVDVNGNLQVTLSNATVINAGYVVGPQGPQGNVGPTGATGAAGTNGTNGTNGVDGVSVTNANVDVSGNLLVTLSNTAIIDAGYVVGPQGPQGIQGNTGPTGPGVPIGGTTGQVLTKVDGTDYNATWSNITVPSANITLTGDITGTGTTGSNIITTLSNTGVTAGSYGSSTLVPVVTVDSKGRITALSTTTVSGGGTVAETFSPFLLAGM